MFGFKNDLSLILKSLNISMHELSNELGFDVPTVSNWLNGKYVPDMRSKEDIYGYAYKKGLRINEAHVLPFSNTAERTGFISLFHGSKNGITGDLDLKHSKSQNDLGNGIYFGETLEQSAMFVANYKTSHVYAYGLYPDGLNIVTMEADLDWLLLIAKNRGRLDEFKDSEYLNILTSKVHGADVIVAPIANNRMFELIDEFVEGIITDTACIKSLAVLNIGKQYCLRTEKAVSKLGFIKEFYMCQEEKENYITKRNISNRERMNKIKEFRKKYREGRYIDEIL